MGFPVQQLTHLPSGKSVPPGWVQDPDAPRLRAKPCLEGGAWAFSGSGMGPPPWPWALLPRCGHSAPARPEPCRLYGALPSCKAGGEGSRNSVPAERGAGVGRGVAGRGSQGPRAAHAPQPGGRAFRSSFRLGTRGSGRWGRRGGARAGRMLRRRDVGDVTARPGRSRRIAWSRRPPVRYRNSRRARHVQGRRVRSGSPGNPRLPRFLSLRGGGPHPGRWDGVPYRPISQMGTEAALGGDPDPARPALPAAGPAPSAQRPGLILGA